MRKTIIATLIVVVLIFSAITVIRSNSAYKKLDRKARALTAERDLLAAKLDSAERLVAELKAESLKPSNDVTAAPVADKPALVEADTGPAFRPPQVTVDPNGKKRITFSRNYKEPTAKPSLATPSSANCSVIPNSPFEPQKEFATTI